MNYDISDNKNSCWMRKQFEMSGDGNIFLFETVTSFVVKRVRSVICGVFVEEETTVAVSL